MTDFVAPIMARYRNYNINGEPSPEIISLDYAPFERGADSIPADARLVLVLIEPRVLEPIAGLGAADDLAGRLLRFKGDLRAEGYHSRFILASVYRGDINQDGRTVIALRRFLREVKTAHPNTEGVVMVGAFPEAALVRRWPWAPSFELTVMGQPRTGMYLSLYPELVDTRTDIVLCDLTGNWEDLYRETDFHLPGIIAYPDAATAARPWADGQFVRTGDFSSDVFRIDDLVFRDVFYVDDATATILERRDLPDPHPLLRLRVESDLRNPEITADDRTRPNKIARPDISVSRINALNVAVDPDPNLRGTDGRTFLDASGNPQTVRSAAEIVPGNQSLIFNHRNPVLERRLYCKYFDLNHRFRVGAFGTQPFRVGSISGTTEFDPNYYAGILNGASNSFGPALAVPNANIADYVSFYKEPSVFRHVIAHSSMWNSGFQDTATREQLMAAVGGNPLRWVRSGDEYRPGYDNWGGAADLFIHRAMWHNNTLRNAGASIVIHGGCDVNAAYGTGDFPYHSPSYAGWQNAEGILFFTNTVALLARAKVFNDDPWGFPEGFRNNDRANVGMAFKNYYETQSQDAGLQTDYAQNKRAYNWSVNGDWTVRLRNKNGLGILQLSNSGLAADHVHPDKAWAGDWNFDRALNSLVCVGDVNGDGADEFVVRSEWGVGILKHDGRRWQSLLAAPRDTWFGGWRYDATVNAGRDTIVGAADLTGAGASEILVKSVWGLGCLNWTGAGLNTSFILQNGGRIGGWVLSTTDNRFEGFGNFDSTSQKEILVTSPWGLGVLSLQSNTSPVMVANNTVLPGGWRINTAENRIAAVADFDGDGRDEILIKSRSAIGVLKVQGNTLVTAAVHAYGTVLGGGYAVQEGDRLWATGNFSGGAARQAVFANASGIHLLRLEGGALVRVAGLNNYQRAGGWLLHTNDNRCAAAADFDGNGRAEMFIYSPWGVGIIGLSEGGVFNSPALHPYGSTLGDWCLESTDTFFGSGNLLGDAARHGVLVKK
jgi:hypothetical protein